jgi:hypothetical protein
MCGYTNNIFKLPILQSQISGLRRSLRASLFWDLTQHVLVNWLPWFLNSLSVPWGKHFISAWTAWPWNVRRIGCPDTSVNRCQNTVYDPRIAGVTSWSWIYHPYLPKLNTYFEAIQNNTNKMHNINTLCIFFGVVFPNCQLLHGRI